MTELLPLVVFQSRVRAIREAQRRGTLIWLIVGVLGSAAAIAFPWDHYGLPRRLLLYVGAAAILVLLLVRLKRLRRIARNLNLTCPTCGGDLWGPRKDDDPTLEDIVEQSGKCPHCHAQLFEVQKLRSNA